jgi:hypothetical protein
MNYLQKIDYELVLKALALFIGIFGSIYQLRKFRFTFRSSIKTDLEILNMLDPSDPNYEIVKKNIDVSIRQIYMGSNKYRFKIYSKADFYPGLLFLISFTIWTYYLSHNGFTIWAFLTGFFALGGIGGILTGLDSGKKNNQQSKEKK